MSDESQGLLQILFGSPINAALTLICAYLVYRLFTRRNQSDDGKFRILGFRNLAYR